MIALAANTDCKTLIGLGKIICQINQLLNTVVPVLLALGVVYFIWGVAQYVIAGEDETKKKGKNQIIYGLIGLTVIVSLWGLVNIVVTTFDLGGEAISTLAVPQTGICPDLPATGAKLSHILNYGTCMIYKSVIPLIFALAVVLFLWGVVQFVLYSGEEAKKERGKEFMIWGIIALAVMVSVWGLVKILGTTFGIEYAIPQVKP